MKRLTIALALVAVFAVSNDALATPMAPAGEVRGEYDPAIGEIRVSVNSVLNWYVEHVGFTSMTGDAPAGLPGIAGNLVTDTDTRIGEFSPTSTPFSYDLNLGNVAATSIPDDGTLMLFWNPQLGVPIESIAVGFVPEPSTFAMLAFGLFGVMATRRRRAV